MRYLTVSEAAEELQLSVPTVKRYLYSGRLTSHKLPGGQHRIPETEVERLLTGTDEPSASTPEPAAGEDDLAARLAVMESWVTELQVEVERLQAALEVVTHYISREPTRSTASAPAPRPEDRHSVLILGPGCRRCDDLFDATTKALSTAGRTVDIERVKHIDDITEFGPILTPALVIDGQVVASGRVPTEAALSRLLQRHLS